MKPLADLIQILLSSGPPGWAVLTILLLQVGKMLGRMFSLSMKGAWMAWDESKKWFIRLTGWGLVKNLLKAAVLYLAFSAFTLKDPNDTNAAKKAVEQIYTSLRSE